MRNGLFQLATILKINQINNILITSKHQLESYNQHTLIPSKQISSHKSFHEDIAILQFAFKKIRTLLLPLKTKLIPTHTSPIIPTINHIYDNDGKELTLDHLIQTDNKEWNQALNNEFGHFTQSNYNNIRYTDLMDFI